MRQLNYQDWQSFDDNIRHLNAADRQCHHTLAGTAEDQPMLQAINHLPLGGENMVIQEKVQRGL